MDQQFWDTQTPQSKRKSELVCKYVCAWATALKKHVIARYRAGLPRLAYVDLFAGRGRYKDGSISTPLMLLKKVIDDQFLRENLVIYFNERDAEIGSVLRNEIEAVPGFECISHMPIITIGEARPEVIREASGTQQVPVMLFIDPYYQLKRDLFAEILKIWGSDCIFFFYYNQYNRDVDNPNANPKIFNDLLGQEKASLLRQQLAVIRSGQRESAFLECLSVSLEELGARHILRYVIKDPRGARSMQYLIFFSRHTRGYDIMKSVMGSASSATLKSQGVLGFDEQSESQYTLVESLIPVHEELAELLMRDLHGTYTVQDVYDFHNQGTPYVMSDYKRALLLLEGQSRINTFPEAIDRPQRNGMPTLADSTFVFFPDD